MADLRVPTPLNLPTSVPNYAPGQEPIPTPDPVNMGNATQGDLLNLIIQSQPTPQPTQAPQGQPGALKKLLMNMARGAAISGGYYAGIPQAEEIQTGNDYRKALTDESRARTASANQIVQTPLGPMDKSVWKSVGPQLLKSQDAAVKLKSTEKISKINNMLKASGLALNYSEDENGNPVLTKQSADEMSPVVAAKVKGTGSPSMARWVSTINDPNASPEEKAIAQKNVGMLQSLDVQKQEARGRSFAYYRGLYQWQVVTDPTTGQITPMQGWQVKAMEDQGTPVIASGRLGAKDQLAVQQLSSEAAPAIGKVRQNISAYDNDTDRKIFARVIHDAGTPRYGQESGWMGNILNTALKEGLSPEGQALVRDLARLNETVGRFRTIMGAPSTDTQMALAMAMLPGPSTPNSKFAEEQLKNFEDMVSLGVNVPMLRGAQGPTGNTPPKGAKVRDYTQLK